MKYTKKILKIECGEKWGEKRDLNPRQLESQSGALPNDHFVHILFHFVKRMSYPNPITKKDI